MQNTGSSDFGRALVLGLGLLALNACAPVGQLDWDLRDGGGNTSVDAQQSTAAAPRPDANGILSYPGYQLATARRGDTVASVAGRLGLNADQLASTNALRPNDSLRAGELLLLPSRVSAAPQPAMIGGSGPVDVTSIATTALDRVGPSPTVATATGGQQPIRHTVARGETAFTIARTYNVSARALADWNNLGADLTVREGQTLIIPVANGGAPSSGLATTAPGIGSPTPTPPSATKPLPDEATEPAAAKPKDTPASPDLGADRTAVSAAKMVTPVQGKIIRAYAKSKNNGIDIAAPAGTAVKAAADGTVAAVTKDTEQVTIVVIRHADGLLTVYAGVDGLTVKKGDAVKRGQSIAKVRAANPAFLHFEVRRGVDSLDPADFL